jgi:exonuclease III
VDTKEPNLSNNDLNQANELINGTSSIKTSSNLEILTVFHQKNIRGLKDKRNDLVSSLFPAFPHILCLTEHHMKGLELEHCHIENYKLGTNYCRKTLEKGGVTIFIQQNLNFTNVNIDEYCLDRHIEACALKLKSTLLNICILALYRAPSGNYFEFLNRLESILNILYTQKTEIIICGDINVNYLADNSRKKCLDSVTFLQSFQYC